MNEPKYKFLSIENENNLRQIISECCENEQLEATLYLLDGLMGWCSLCFNNEQEEQDYNTLAKAYNLLLEVKESYKKNY